MARYWGKDVWAADIETTGHLRQMRGQSHPKQHNFAAINCETQETVLFEGHQKKEIEEFISGKVLAIHYGTLFDAEALKFFCIDTSKTTIIDTLALSWYLEPSRAKHGLEDYGVEFGVPKPKIYDWESLTQEDYNHRVIEDCKIQRRLWLKQKKYLSELYSDDEVGIEKVLNYLMWKMEELRVQQENQWKLDVAGAEALEKELQEAVDFKLKELASVMPKVPVIAKKKRPKEPFKKNGELSVTGIKWKALCEDHGVDFNFDGEVKVVTDWSEPNPQSHIQIKAWLDGLGWEPLTFKFVRDKETNETRNIPQINLKGGDVCSSVKELFSKCPDLEHLAGLGILKHRLSVVQGFLKHQENGFVFASVQGFTNTLRMQHSAPLCNLPSVRVKYGKELRGLLIAREGKQLLGSDLSSLEDRIKHHFQWKLDPEYVKSQMTDGFDPHLAIACMAGLMTQDEVDFYKWYKANH